MDARTIRELDNGHWALTSPYRCPCKGNGWMVSDFDTWHRCPIHGRGVPHPESEGDFDYAEHFTTVARKAFIQFRSEARTAGYTGKFTESCRERIQKEHPTIEEWVQAAEELSNQWCRKFGESLAQRAGYSCALEHKMAEETIWEHKERDE